VNSPSVLFKPEVPANEHESLAYEKFIAEVLRLRKVDSAKKPWWQIFLESAGGAALISVVLGGILGAWITGAYQARQATIERERAAHLKLQDLRFESNMEALTLIWSSIAAAEDLLHLSTQAFADAPSSERDEIRKKYNLADAKWRSVSNGELGFKLKYYYRDSPEFAKSWDTARLSVSKYLDCAADWIEDHPFFKSGLGTGCVTQREAVDQDLLNLENIDFKL
jgi:hypothetical protein